MKKKVRRLVKKRVTGKEKRLMKAAFACGQSSMYPMGDGTQEPLHDFKEYFNHEFKLIE